MNLNVSCLSISHKVCLFLSMHPDFLGEPLVNLRTYIKSSLPLHSSMKYACAGVRWKEICVGVIINWNIDILKSSGFSWGFMRIIMIR